MGQSLIQRSFGAGELAPAQHARADLAKYLSGLRTCSNFIVRREGGVSNRAGLRHIASAKTTSATVRLFRFVSPNPGNSVLIEMGLGYFRFVRNGAPVTLAGVAAYDPATTYVPGDIVRSGAVNYYCKVTNLAHPVVDVTYWFAMTGNLLEVPNHYATVIPEADQAGSYITLTNTGEAPYQLVCYSLTRWVLQAFTTAPAIVAPTGVIASTLGLAGLRTFAYKVTTGRQEDYQESEASAVATIGLTSEPTADAPHTISWNAVALAAEYYVYCDPYGNGTYGFIGTATGGVTFQNVGFPPDFAVTPPIARTPFVGVNNYPAVSATYQQRLMFAQTINTPDGIWGSRTGFQSNFSISSPLQDDDAITLRIAAAESHRVQWLIPLKQLVAMTAGGGWVIGRPSEPLTPSDLPADQHDYAGSAAVRPIVVGSTIVYVQARGSVIRDLRFDMQVEGFAGRDLTLFASHLFDGYTVVRQAIALIPHSIIWVVRSDGTLLGLTYIPELDVWGWHTHTTQQNATDASFEDVCTVPEDGEDATYVLVRRTINGATVRYIEQLESRSIVDFDEDSFFVDAGKSYLGTPIASATGLSHLEGQTVAIVGDGAVIYNGDPSGAAAATYRVTAGAVALGANYTNVHVGLAIQNAEIETLDLDVQGSNLRDKVKRVGSVTLLVERSSRGFYAGQDATHFEHYTKRDFDAAEDEHTGQCELPLQAEYNVYGRVLVRQTDPLPLTILGIIPNVVVGG